MQFLTEKISKLFGQFLIWRVRNISQQNFVLILAMLVGLFSGLAAVILKNAIHFMHDLLTKGFDLTDWNYMYLLYPMIGIFITMIFVRYIVKDDISHGVTRILYAISKKESNLKAHNSFTSIIASTFTIGFGGSVGAEAPIVLTGSSIGSSLGRLFMMNYKTVTLLIGCGAAGAIAGIFKAPIAGLMFTMEVLMLGLTASSVVPLLLSAVVAASVAYFFLGEGAEFTFLLEAPFELNNLPFYILLGVVGGVVSQYMTWGTLKLEKRMGKITNPYYKWLAGGFVLSVLIFLFPPLYGEGYDTITAMLSDDSSAIVENSIFYTFRSNNIAILAFLVLIILFKVVASTLTNASGGVGGIFAPTLFLGGVTGYFLALLMNELGADLPVSHFTLVGMAALMSGVMHAPLTAIFLIAEITNGYALFIPLITVSAISFLTNKYFEPHTIYTKRLARRGELITHHKDKAVLTLMRLNKVIERDFLAVKADHTLGELVKTIAKAKRNLFPVLDKEKRLIGVVTLEDIREIMFKNELYQSTTVQQLMTVPPAFIQTTDLMDDVMKKFEDTGAWNLPVIEDDKYIGFVSKSKIFSAYRRVLIHFSDD
ncbi:chloride channel protein [Alkalitalea saponilacus]|uniref:Chloride channel protein, CIC family n=1 Tax=Alkalitalea saponilacus TaxID=889453 RepID=A0A1T5CNJ2_9BACT|nr:chloride channel protein [Alkalitalea saponilacus]ASB49928.1 chloride channel protein [Alkalitalea saponilacus]SKB61007.1 chloride channel protein, CIC family [Alkalitalea saponilacus]